MRKYRIFALAAVLTVAGLGSSCDDFLDVNDNPNQVQDPAPANLLVSSETQLGFLMGSDLFRYTSLFAQHLAGQGGSGVQQAEYDRYNITATDMNNVWRTAIYGGAQADMQKLVEATEGSSPAYSGIAKIMQAFLFTLTADAFGDVPFSEALRFADNRTPRYDSSQEVYAGAIRLINAGIADLQQANSTLRPTGDDIIYGGDAAKWIKFGNTLKLRLFLHSVPKQQTNGALDSIARLVGRGPNTFMTSTADNFQMRFEATPGKTNPIHQYEISRPNQLFPSTTLVNLMNTRNDPRRSTYFTEVPAGQFTGAGNGTGAVGAPQLGFSRMGVYLRGARTGTGVQAYAGDAPVRMLTFAEYNFILAEYYARTGNLGSAQTSYVAGIRASMSMAGVTTAAADTYVASRPALTAANAVQSIIEEKYIANFGVAVEPWTDWRRTGVPALNLAANAVLTAIPRILPYSDLERVANPANTPARSSEDLTRPQVFWDR